MTQTGRSMKWRVWHRWLSLIFGMQMVLWALSGAYMVFFDIDYIHGDHLVNDTRPVIDQQADIAPVEAVLRRYPDTQTLSLQSRFLAGRDVAVYVLASDSGKQLINARTLDLITLREADITALAKHYYTRPEAEIVSVAYLTEKAPSEISPRMLPVWQINFDDFGSTSFYVSEATGALLVKRHTFWRGFDFVWMLHIMDYDTRSDIETWWLKGFIIGTLVLMITGCVLLVYTLRKPATAQGGAQ